MKREIIIIALLVIAFSSCKKEDNILNINTSNNNDTITIDYTGNYSGIITVKIDKRADGDRLDPINVLKTEIMEVNITFKDSTYYLDNIAMSGGPNTYSLNNSKGIYLFNLSERKIDYSYIKQGIEYISISAGNSWKYYVTESRSGTLK
jgi:hypothetical protein